jgi:translation initiation factor 1A|uniref:S1-like domain-containing protein n=2 Tax=Cryptomonas curvata TaxID=233186 RepID=A0A7S0QUU8_9CRYP|mmetsp:Transcript_7949/g.16946  ORF Transcript_7949/g.16946 Transcript_7949/m.16946 type:complete len:154 (+) Transcript_7949:56-517(+)|eukprot:CAMPEP_0172161558 /NCGR_PEP_ID=MMETSP1050-20130122/6193_1 /TAXON_ID=233186 /ORGANISM="Cryptomonas curvata, Strain CCAP979/52" /LENGTH=153 /DNA_ID=CAMNT_0012831471 /DNA_START=290 /DNA_END=751 /DNA_ORIENTATION=+
MPKNKGKGGKNRSRAKSDRNDKRELHYKNTDEGQEYAQVLKMLGGPWLEAYCFDGQKRLCHICGKMGRKVRITVGDVVLISLRGFQDNKADVIDKYLPDEVRTLKTAGELPESVKLNETEDGGDDIEFGSGGEEEEEEEKDDDDDQKDDIDDI